MRRFCLIVLGLMFGMSPAMAQPLVERIPSDAIIYLGWTGSQKLPAGFDQSHLSAVLKQSQLGELFAEVQPWIIRRLKMENVPNAEMIEKQLMPPVVAMVETMWKNPSALYVGPLDYSGKVPMPKIALMSQAGKNAQDVADKITALVQQIPADAPVKIKVQVWGGDTLVVSNFEIGERLEESLSQREQFKNCLKQGRPDPMLTFYFDTEKVLNVVSLGINMAADAKTKQTFQRLLMVSGIGGLRRMIYTAGLDGKEWGSQAFLDAPQPRMGLLSTLIDAEPVTDDLLKLAPPSSSWIAATRWDFAKLMGDARGAVARLDANSSRNLEEGLKALAGMLGVDIQKDLLANLGDQWLAYNSNQTGHGVLGLVLVSPLRDAAKAQAALLKLQQTLAANLTDLGKQNEMTISITTTKMGDTDVHCVNIPAVAPCWAIKNGNLYVALYPQVLAGALEQDASAGKSVLQNEDFAAWRKRIGGGSAVSISYMDLPKLAPRGYQMVMVLQRGLLGLGDLFDMKTPMMVLPTLGVIKQHLTPSIGATWVDETGWHYRGITPFPAADLLGGEQALLGTIAPLLPAVVAPALAR